MAILEKIDSPQGDGPPNTMGPIEVYLFEEANSGGHWDGQARSV